MIKIKIKRGPRLFVVIRVHSWLTFVFFVPSFPLPVLHLTLALNLPVPAFPLSAFRFFRVVLKLCVEVRKVYRSLLPAVL